MQIIQAGFDVSNISDWIGLVILLASSAGVFILKTIKTRYDDLKDVFREYKDTTAALLNELINSKNETNSRLDKIEIKLDIIEREHNKHHG